MSQLQLGHVLSQTGESKILCSAARPRLAQEVQARRINATDRCDDRVGRALKKYEGFV